jgi:hypothetical protein
MDSKIKRAKVWGVITAIAIVAIAFFVLKQIPSRTSSFDNLSFSAPSGGSSASNTMSPETLNVMKETKMYQHPSGFTFQYPATFSITAFPDEGEGEVVLVQNADRTTGFQIFALPFDEKGPLTQERIQRDVPGISMTDVAPISISGNDSGITFISKDGATPNREVWFIYKGYLYQILTPIGAQKFLEEVLGTWRF